MNKSQRIIFLTIKSIIQNRELSEEDLKNSNIRYNILNLIARWSLANDTYLLTEIARNHLVENKFMQDEKMTRSKKSQKNGFTYEHPVPSNEICELIMKDRFNDDAIKEILFKTNIVTVITKKENDLLNENKLSSKMPIDWCFETDDMFARYKNSGVEVPTKVIGMSGAIYR
jgi:hypothetical protein